MPIKLKDIELITSDGYTCVYKPDTYSLHKCDGCGCEFKVRTGEHIYKLPVHVPHATKHLKFCSYNCRSRYKKNNF